MPACKLIVHADDFGLSQKINEGIVQAHRYGIVTSTSLIANAPAFEHAIALSRAAPTLDVGVHLTLVEEKPISRTGEIPSLLDNRGRLHQNAQTFMWHYLLQRISLDEVRCELDAQISKVVSNGIRVTHLDGHQHLHVVPGIRRVVGSLARKYLIPVVRYPRETISAYMLREKHGTMRLIQLTILNTFCTFADTSGSRQADHFVGFFFGGRLTKKNLITVLQHLPSYGVCELMCHPGLNDSHCRHRHWGYRWQDEYDALVAPEIQDYLKSNGVGLISFRDLTA